MVKIAYKRKLEDIEAVQVIQTTGSVSLSEITQWVIDNIKSGFLEVVGNAYLVYMVSGDDTVAAEATDWIVRDRDGMSVYSDTDFHEEFDVL